MHPTDTKNDVTCWQQLTMLVVQGSAQQANTLMWLEENGWKYDMQYGRFYRG